MTGAFAFDEREWMRDELLIKADEWAEIMAGAEARQAEEIRYMLFDLVQVKQYGRLSTGDALRLERTIDKLREQLLALRR